MKRIWSILLTMTVALTLLCPMTAYAATGEGNIDGGGGNLGDATSHGSWNPGNEGVRVTIVRSDDHAVVSTPIDLTNRAPAASIYHFGKVSKLQYTNGVALSPVQGSYTCIKPTQAVPRIISTNGRNNIEAIKSYFTDEQVTFSVTEDGRLRESGEQAIDYSDRKETKNHLKRLIYRKLSNYTGQELPWGTLTGIRPTKIAMGLLEQGKRNVEIAEYMRNTYLASKEKVA